MSTRYSTLLTIFPIMSLTASTLMLITGGVTGYHGVDLNAIILGVTSVLGWLYVFNCERKLLEKSENIRAGKEETDDRTSKLPDMLKIYPLVAIFFSSLMLIISIIWGYRTLEINGILLGISGIVCWVLTTNNETTKLSIY